MSTTIDQITEQLKTRKADALNAYRELRALIATDGKTPKPDEIERILRDSGKTIDDLSEDAKRYRRRDEWREEIAKVPEINSEIESARAGIEAENEKLEAAKQAHFAAVRPLQSIIASANDSLVAATAARSELVKTMWPEDKAELTRLSNRCETAHRESREASESLASIKSRTKYSGRTNGNNYGWLSPAEEQSARNAEPSVPPAVIARAEQRAKDANEALQLALKARDDFMAEATAR